jgi:CPA2 family monovalent cation:H+ antiporter-2
VLILVVLGPLTARYTQPPAERLTTRFGGRFGVTPERRDVAERPAEAEAGTEPEPERAGEARQQTAVPD